MNEPEIIDLFQLAREITTTGLLIAVIYGFLSGKLVTRFHYDEMKDQFQKRIDRIKNGQRIFPLKDPDS